MCDNMSQSEQLDPCCFCPVAVCVFVSASPLGIALKFSVQVDPFCVQQLLLLPSLLSFPIPPFFQPNLFQNHLFFPNQIQHLEEEELLGMFIVLCVRTNYRRAGGRAI
ncbi:hypothetical protein XENOCAPTIV_023635 [Xenoophorus captivus]|uniref:Uncharacterized protein n=1 Tax=Xenoophorus captivus TaxID=1517983 RepID=A0ABV0R4J9_9TELE